MDSRAEDRLEKELLQLAAEVSKQRKWSEDEVKILESWIKAGRALAALGWLGGLIKPIVIGAAAVLAALIAIRLNVQELFSGWGK